MNNIDMENLGLSQRFVIEATLYKVSAKYCYVTRKLRLHQNDRCKRFPLF